jgi:hypothetical protein
MHILHQAWRREIGIQALAPRTKEGALLMQDDSPLEGLPSVIRQIVTEYLYDEPIPGPDLFQKRRIALMAMTII